MKNGISGFSQLMYKGMRVIPDDYIPFGEVWYMDKNGNIVKKRLMTPKEFKKNNKPPWGEIK